MEKQHRELIRGNLTDLIEHTQFNESLQNKLVESRVFSQSMMDKLMSSADSHSRTRQLFLDVQRRGPEAFQKTVNALVESGNRRAAKILDSNVDDAFPAKVWNPPNYQERPQQPYTMPPELPDSTRPLDIQVRKPVEDRLSTLLASNCLNEVYRMEAKPSGYVLIINNEEFVNNVLQAREGSSVDANNLDKLFLGLGFEVRLRRDLGYKDMVDELDNFAEKKEHAESDMAVIIILSHGRSGYVSAADGREVKINSIIEKFNNAGCPALKGKPKMFIFQACRGDEVDSGSMTSRRFPEMRTQTDAQKIDPEDRFKDPSFEDIIVLYSTVAGFVSNRDLYRGTWFIECICSVFMQYAATTELMDMLREVSSRLRKYESEMGTKQSATFETTQLYKRLYFNVPD